MFTDQIRGHQPVLEMLQRGLSRGRMPHALLFVGDAGIGKRRVAQHLAECLFCQQSTADQLVCCNKCSSCRQMAAGTHPDLISVECPPDKAILPLSLIIGKDDQRGREGVCYEMSLRPMSGDRRIAIIDDADKMNAESANALLKTLEEPTANYLMILIASEIDAILPTIRSRCQTIRFGRLSDEDVVELLIQQQLVDSRDQATQIARLAEGSLETANQLVDDSLETLRVNILKPLSQKPFQPQVFAQSIIQAIDDIGGNTAAQRKTANWILKFCSDFYNQALQYLAGYSSVQHSEQLKVYVSGFSGEIEDQIEKMGKLLDRMVLTEVQINQNATIALCIESLSEDLNQILKG